MDWSSWFRLSYRSAKSQNQQNQKQHRVEEEAQLGVTHQLIDHVKSFTVETFKNFPLQAEEEEEESGGATFGDEIMSTSSVSATSANVRKDLSEWQERHATLVLSKIKELSQLRFKLCPRQLKERDFWRIYFALVKSYTAEYELQAIRVAKIRRMAKEKEKSSDTGGFEVEMAEKKQEGSPDPPTP